jgi:hypothetical protein
VLPFTGDPLDLALRRDAHMLEKLAKGHIELVFVHLTLLIDADLTSHSA